MISASLPSEALAQLGQLGQLSHLYPPAPPPPGMTPEFLAPPPRPYARYPPRARRDHQPPSATPAFPPVPGAYPPFLPHYSPYLQYRQRPQQPSPTYPIRPRLTSGFVPPAPAPRSPPTPPQLAPLPPPPVPEPPPPVSPDRGTPNSHFCRGALISLEDGSYRRVEEMRTEDFVVSADHCGDVTLTQCTLLRLEERAPQDRLSLTLTYDRNRSQVELESTVEHPFFVYGRGWASYRPERTYHRYGLRVQRLQVGDVCVSLVPKKHVPPPPQTHPENLSVKEDSRKRRWSAPEVVDDDRPPAKKR